MNDELKNKKIGLALGGGFIRALSHIGVIEVLQNYKIPIDIVSGCSSGAVVAACYSAGELDNLKKRFLNASKRDFIKVIFEPTIPRQGLLKGDKVRDFFNEFLKGRTFDQLDKKLLLAATDLKNRCQVIITQGEVATAARACVTVPGFFVPIKDGQRILVDGGNFNLIPSLPLYQAGADYVIAVDTTQPPNVITRTLAFLKSKFKRNIEAVGEGYCSKEELKNFNIFDLIYRAVHLSTDSISSFYHYNYKYDVLIKPQVLEIGRTDIKKIKECIQAGRQAAELAIPKIKKDLGV